MKRPPVEGVPKVRPRCQFCGKAIAMFTTDKREGSPSVVVRRTFSMWRGYGRCGEIHPIFCTLRCSLAFALASYRAGYRIERH